MNRRTYKVVVWVDGKGFSMELTTSMLPTVNLGSILDRMASEVITQATDHVKKEQTNV